MYYDEATGTLYGAFRYPGVVEHVGALNTRDGSVRRLADIKRAMLYRVASFAYDPATGTAFYTNDNLALRDLMAVDVKTGEERMLLEDARIGEIVFNPVDRSLIGVRHENGLATLVRIPYPYDRMAAGLHVSLRVVPYDLDISPDGKLLSASMSEVNGDQFLRVWELDKVLQGDVKPLSRVPLRTVGPGELRVLARRPLPVRQQLLHRRVEHLPLRSRHRRDRGGVECRDRLLPSGAARRRPARRADLHGRRLRPGDHRSAADRGRQRDHVPRRARWSKNIRCQDLAGAAAQHGRRREADHRQGAVRRRCATSALDNAYPVLQGYKDSVGIGYHFNFDDPLEFANLGITAAYTPGDDLPGDQRGHVDINGRYLGWRGELSWNRSDFYDLFGPTKRSRKGYAAKVGYDWLLIYDEPRKLDAQVRLRVLRPDRHAADAQNVDTNFTRLTTGEVGLYYTDVRRSLGAVDDEKGLAWSAWSTRAAA